MKKIIGIVVAVIIVAVVAVGLYVYFALSSLVKAGIETYAPRITKTAVTVDSVSASPLGGALTINGLAIANPAGFKSKDALMVQKASITVDPSSVFSDVVHVKSIEITTPHVTFEPGQGSNNLSVLQHNMTQTAQADTGQGAPKEQSGTPKKLIIDHFVIGDAQATLAVPQAAGAAALVGQQSSASVTLPTIDMRDLGTKEGGLPPSKIAAEIMARIESQTEKAVQANAQKLIDSVTKGAGDALKNAPSGGDVGKQLKGLLGR